MLLIDTKIKQKPFRNVVLKLKSMRGFHWSEKVYYVAACKNRKIIVQDILNQYFKNLYSTSRSILKNSMEKKETQNRVLCLVFLSLP